MRYIRLFALALILMSYSIIAVAQQDNAFSDDLLSFPSELNSYFENQRNRGVLLTLQEFTKDWEEDKFTNEVRKDIVRVSNLFRKAGIRPHMGYTEYLSALSSFTETTGNQSILAWHKALVPLIDSKLQRQLKSFLENTAQFNLTHILFKLNTNTWLFEGEGFNYYFDTTLRVELKNVNLVCWSGRDSISLFQTSGNYFPLNDKFKGRGGKVTWQKFGYLPNTVYAIFDKYEIDLKLNGWKADTVNFFHKDYFREPLVGSFEDKVLTGVPLDKSTFPKFESFNKDIGIKNLFRNVDYYGGFGIEGSRILGSGSEFSDATVTVHRGDQVLVRLASKTFVIRPDRFVSQRAIATVYHESDSIYHPGLNVRYQDENKELVLMRNGEGVSGSPFYSSFHKIDMYFQGMYYILDDDKFTFEMIRGLNRKETAIFESQNYYSEERFSKLQGIDELNPINVIYNYTERIKRDNFLLPELVEYMRKPFEQVKAMVINLSNGGFVSYSINNDRIEVKSKLYDYLHARSKKADYDVIQIKSNVNDGANAILDLKSFNITVKGVDSVSLSDIKAVKIVPRDREIIIGPNRDFVFTGLVNAGYFTFYSNKSSFEYDKFKLNMPNVDSMSFEVDTLNRRTQKLDRMIVRNVIANLSGELLIDDPTNKSGIKKLEVYPLFNSQNDAFVYYDHIEGGIYNKENFYYTVYPFTIDSLNSFTTEGLKFDGSLFSGDILPVIEEPLRVMEDYSLGFRKTLDEHGLPAYNGMGTYFSDIALDNRGLHGRGSLEFITSTSKSDDFRFFPDSLVANLSSFVIKEKAEDPSFPGVEAEGVHQHWVPALDSMSLTTLPGKEFKMYGARSYHSGELALTSEGLYGAGKSRMDNADIISNGFNFKNQSFSSDTTNFKLYYPERPTLSLATTMNSGSVDFLNKQGVFGIPGESQRIELPHSKYVCYMDQIEWSMEESELKLTNSLVKMAELSDTIDLKQLVDYDFTGSEFVSTDPKRDSLKFFAMEATYRMKENIINAREVKIIRVADVAIFPGDGKVTILADGDMQPLTGANIIANREFKYHRIYDADVEVNSRQHYVASGYLDYIDDRGNVTPLWLNPVTVDSAYKTYGVSVVKAENFLPLNDYFNFIGKLRLSASSPNHYYDGLFQLNNECQAEDHPWVQFKSELDSKDIRIPVTLAARDSINDPILFGVIFSDFFAGIYPSVFEKPRAYGDTLLIGTEGYIRYDRTQGHYIAASKERLDGKSGSGNLITINTDRCILEANGNLNIGVDLGSVGLKTFGEVAQFTLADSTRFKMSVVLDFFFSSPALARLYEDIQLTELGSSDANSESFKLFLINLMGEAQARSFLEELNLTGQVRKMPDALNKSLIFNDVSMVWDRKLKSYVSEGQIGISAIGGNIANRKVNGYLEIGKRRTGDIVNIYLELNSTTWYYFTYGNGIMQAISSNNDFNSILSSLSEKKRTLDTGSGEAGYQFIISTPDARLAFMRKMQQRQYTNQEP